MKIISSTILIALLFLTFDVQAQFLESGQEKLVFAYGMLRKDVTWSANFALAANELQTKQLPANHSQDIWVQSHALPIGLSWRPPSSAAFSVSLAGSINEADPTFRTETQVFIRYSCDKTNWSTWYAFTKTDKITNDGLGIYESQILLPYSASERYRELMREWWRSRPIWSSDENEFCEWLIQREPDFFVKEMPFIGYVQIRIEKSAVRLPQVLKSVTIGYGWGVSGIQTIPRDKSKVRQNTGAKWFFIGRNPGV